MELELDLRNIPENQRLPFCNYIINVLEEIFTNLGDLPRFSLMEKYINDNHYINWQAKKNDYISVSDLYRLATTHLEIKNRDKTIYKISINPNENIPNSYTTILPIISLLEYGTLSIKKIGLLTKYMEDIANNLDYYYDEFLVGVDKWV